MNNGGNEKRSSQAALVDRLDTMAGAVAGWLAGTQSPDGGFPARDFYGKAFAAALWARTDRHRFTDHRFTDHRFTDHRFTDSVQSALAAIRSERIDPKTYHYEFNRFALAKLGEALPAAEARTIPRLDGFRGTRVANWMLLRVNCRYQAGGLVNRLLAACELRAVKWVFGRKPGLIEDQVGAYTTQYHAFSLALLGELLAGPCGNARWLRAWFRQSLDGFCALILPGGQCNYIGRGSLQSFGYGAAILALAHGYAVFANPAYLRHLGAVLAWLHNHQNSDGSIPLVLSGGLIQEGPAASFDPLDDRYPGWWSYNNYFDYLPFTGLMLSLASSRLTSGVPAPASKERADEREQRYEGSADDLFRAPQSHLHLVRRQGHSAVVALPGKIWAAGVPMPFIALNDDKNNDNDIDPAHRYPLPVCGGEQMQASLYTVEGLPLPILETRSERICCADARYRWLSSDTFEGRLAGVRHRRRFRFDDASITIHDEVAWGSALKVTSVRLPRLLLADHPGTELVGRRVSAGNTSFEFSDDVTVESTRYFSPNGYLVAYTIEKVPGDAQSVACELIIRLGSG